MTHPLAPKGAGLGSDHARTPTDTRVCLLQVGPCSHRNPQSGRGRQESQPPPPLLEGPWAQQPQELGGGPRPPRNWRRGPHVTRRDAVRSGVPVPHPPCSTFSATQGGVAVLPLAECSRSDPVTCVSPRPTFALWAASDSDLFLRNCYLPQPQRDSHVPTSVSHPGKRWLAVFWLQYHSPQTSPQLIPEAKIMSQWIGTLGKTNGCIRKSLRCIKITADVKQHCALGIVKRFRSRKKVKRCRNTIQMFFVARFEFEYFTPKHLKVIHPGGHCLGIRNETVSHQMMNWVLPGR